MDRDRAVAITIATGVAVGSVVRGLVTIGSENDVLLGIANVLSIGGAVAGALPIGAGDTSRLANAVDMVVVFWFWEVSLSTSLIP